MDVEIHAGELRLVQGLIDLYLGSSMRNAHRLDEIADRLASDGWHPYRFWQAGFAFAGIDPNWQNWSPETALTASVTGLGAQQFRRDLDAIYRAEIAIFVTPFGADAGSELGFLASRGTPVIVHHLQAQPGLMVANWASAHTFTLDGLIATARHLVGRE